MITQEYIESFKKSRSFNIISKGLIKGDIEKVLLGKSPYRITSQYEMEDTIPSQVLISIHILILEGKLSSENINNVFLKIPINPELICLLLDYLNIYITYQKNHDALKIDYMVLLDKIKRLESEYQKHPCYRNLITSIENNLSNNQS